MKYITDLEDLRIGDYVMSMNGQRSQTNWVTFSRVDSGMELFMKEMPSRKIIAFYSVSSGKDRAFEKEMYEPNSVGIMVDADHVYLLNDAEIRKHILMEVI